MRSIAILAVLALATMAGCLDSSSNEDTPEPTTTETPEPMMGMPATFNGTGNIARSVGTPVGSFNQGTGGEFTVQDNATLIFAEMMWDTTDSLELALDSPDQPAGQDFFEYTSGSTSSPQNFTITAEDAGENWVGAWAVTAFAEGAALDVDYHWAITVFYGETSVPAGYTGLHNATA